MEQVRVVALWNNGAYVSSVDSEFQAHLNELIAQYGRPDSLDLHTEADWDDGPKMARTSEEEEAFRENLKRLEVEAELFNSRYSQAADAIDCRVSEACRLAGSLRSEETPLVVYSVSATEEGLPVDNLDELAVEGRVKFVNDDWSLKWGGGRPYESPVVENPTWMQVVVFAEEMIRATEDDHHVFLESVTVLKDTRTDEHGDYLVAQFCMGS